MGREDFPGRVSPVLSSLTPPVRKGAHLAAVEGPGSPCNFSCPRTSEVLGQDALVLVK